MTPEEGDIELEQIELGQLESFGSPLSGYFLPVLKACLAIQVVCLAFLGVVFTVRTISNIVSGC